MTTQQLNAELLHNLSIIATDEELMKRAVRAIRRIVAKKKDLTSMSEDEFTRMCREGEEEYQQGKTTRLLKGESIEDMLRRTGYDV